MPMISVNGTRLHYEDGGPGGEPVLFSHGLLWNTSLFAPQMASLSDRYRPIAYDHRGQGQSADHDGPEIGMDLLTEDAAALISGLNLGPVHFCGLSMGGFVGMRLAARYPDLVRSLILCDTSAEAEVSENRPRYRLLCALSRWLGPRMIAARVMPIMHGRTALSDPARGAERAFWLAQVAGNRRSIWRAINGVINRAAVIDELPRITAPTLVIVGEEDVATRPEKSERIAKAIAGARLVRIPGAGHSSTVEQPAAVTAAIREFLEDVTAAGERPEGQQVL
ncbi:MAG: alpha/beta fold hydrolase [Telmatospirillum sp.]|nr:alpha/beta fold hydrolase [Telmatospirillum sp.]